MSTRSDRKPAIRELVRETVTNAILDAAEAVAAERGVEGTSIAAIAERAGVAVGTLYNYFPDRDALLAGLFATRRDAMRPRIEALAGTLRGQSVQQRLQAYLEGVLGVLEDYRRFCRLVVIDDGTFTRIKGKQKPALDNVLDEVATILRPVSGTHASVHAQMVVGSMKALLRVRLEQEAPLAPDAALIAATFVHGLAGKGR